MERAKREHPNKIIRRWLNWWDQLVHNMPTISIKTLRILSYGHYIGYMTSRNEMQKELNKVEEDLMNEKLTVGEQAMDILRMSSRITELEKTNAIFADLLSGREILKEGGTQVDMDNSN
ncbi:MAG: hypothetical protein M0P29_11190 [Sphaerochaetaceae bacterium]|jgi:uncharacterized protein YrrD|nr:hypothetical protein [Sphaerochaetaceae bacterium]